MIASRHGCFGSPGRADSDLLDPQRCFAELIVLYRAALARAVVRGALGRGVRGPGPGLRDGAAGGVEESGEPLVSVSFGVVRRDGGMRFGVVERGPYVVSAAPELWGGSV